MYRCLNANFFENEAGYVLIPLRAQDIELIRAWRNSQLDILRQKTPISPAQQLLYFEEVIRPTFTQEYPPQVLFSLLLSDTCIGYGGLTHLDWEARHAEVSFLLDPFYVSDAALYRRTFGHYLSLLFQAAFSDLHLHRLYTDTYAFREDHIATLEAAGFQREGRMRDHIFKREKWEDSLIHGLLFNEKHI